MIEKEILGKRNPYHMHMLEQGKYDYVQQLFGEKSMQICQKYVSPPNVVSHHKDHVVTEPSLQSI